jgi:hypothetical protein
MPSGCPALEGYPCTYKEKVEAGWGVFLLNAVGGIYILVFLGIRKMVGKRHKAVVSK